MAADAPSFDPAQIDAVFQPLSFDVALNQDSAFSYPTSSAPADAAQVDAVAAYAATSSLPMLFRPMWLLMLPHPMLSGQTDSFGFFFSKYYFMNLLKI